MPSGYVQALRDFRYDDQVGQVRQGQVFRVGGHRNDQSLLRHRFMIVFDDNVGDLFEDNKGRKFATEWQKERAGREDERPAVEVIADRRAAVSDRVQLVGQ